MKDIKKQLTLLAVCSLQMLTTLPKSPKIEAPNTTNTFGKELALQLSPLPSTLSLVICSARQMWWPLITFALVI